MIPYISLVDVFPLTLTFPPTVAFNMGASACVAGPSKSRYSGLSTLLIVAANCRAGVSSMVLCFPEALLWV